ncbi:hypothetical protein [Dactylosporangium sp. NPDC051541]|uniref:hypothetical protein n=1 Tax=Dactylosporangium sp. NPDC051541 TaxID=3363977 RepID=UPI0037B1A74D
MQTDEPAVGEMERATADLLRLAFVEIRFLTEDRQEDQSPEAVIRRRKRVNAIADICHNLPGLLAPGRRDRLADGLRYLVEHCQRGQAALAGQQLGSPRL